MVSTVSKENIRIAIKSPNSLVINILGQRDSSLLYNLNKDETLITPIKQPKYTLDELLAAIQNENMHHELQIGSVLGKEMWLFY